MQLIHQHSPSPLNPLGVKGVGEGGAIAPPVVIANAVCDALRPFKVEFNRTPIKPQHIAQAVRSRHAPADGTARITGRRCTRARTFWQPESRTTRRGSGG